VALTAVALASPLSRSWIESAPPPPGLIDVAPRRRRKPALAQALHGLWRRWRFQAAGASLTYRSTIMKGLIKTAALAALLASMGAFAQDPAAAGGKGGDFASLDANGDGSVSQDEAKADATLSAKFAELDTDKDGKISSSEYKKMASGKEEKKY
jgi:EF hand domain-containing protein